jgi:hypothetical protein
MGKGRPPAYPGCAGRPGVRRKPDERHARPRCARQDRCLAEGAKRACDGFLTGPQYQALLQEAAPAISKFDDEQKKFEEERKKAATGNVSVNPDIVPLEDNRRVVLYLARGQNCQATAEYVGRVFANRLDLQFRGGWQTFAADKAGNFARSFPSPWTGMYTLLVKGNVKTRLVSVKNVSSHCLWKGSF